MELQHKIYRVKEKWRSVLIFQCVATSKNVYIFQNMNSKTFWLRSLFSSVIKNFNKFLKNYKTYFMDIVFHSLCHNGFLRFDLLMRAMVVATYKL